jgi:multicomponent Na+:H+ antiporter subunit F
MADFMIFAAVVILAIVAAGLIRILHGPARADRMMAAQLLGSGSIAALLLRAAATSVPAISDVALVLALLAAFVSVAFAINASPAEHAAAQPTGDEG